MVDPELKHKQIKAKRYATEPDLFRLLEIKLRMRSKHGTRLISFSSDNHGSWKCSCPFFKKRGTCSHIMAAKEILSVLLPPTTCPEGEGECK